MSTSYASAAARRAATVSARQGSTAGQGDTVQQQAAWQREMERAQMANWFKPPLAADQGNVAAASGGRAPEALARIGRLGAAQAAAAITDSNPASIAPGLSMSLEPLAASPRINVAGVFEGAAEVPHAAVRFFAEMRPAVVAEAPSETKPIAGVQLRCGASAITTLSDPVEGSAPDAEADAVAESRAQSSTPDAQAPVRLHEESMPEGQAVWIAMRADDDALAAMLPRIVADLQRGVQDRGQRLHQVVCNGRLVWRDRTEALGAGDTSIPGGTSHSTAVDSFHSKGA